MSWVVTCTKLNCLNLYEFAQKGQSGEAYVRTNIVEKKRRFAPTFQALSVHKVKNNDGNCRPGNDEGQDQYPGHGGAEGGVQIIHHGAFGHSCSWSTRLTSFALKDSGGGGRGPCYRKTHRS